MLRLILSILILLSAAISSAEAINNCTSELLSKIDVSAGRAKKICQQANKKKVSLFQFNACLTGIHSETQLAPEIIADYCVKRPDSAYKSCVISAYKSNTNDNAFKSCLKKRAPASLGEPELEAPQEFARVQWLAPLIVLEN